MRILLGFIAFLPCFNLNAYIISVHLITLKNGQELILFYDAYEGYTLESNNINALLVLEGISKIARVEPEEVFDFSYEDPGIYDLGTSLKNIIKNKKNILNQIQDNQSVLLLPPVPGINKFDCFGVKKPEISGISTGFSSFLGGAMTRIIAEFDWPKNLAIRSNDPRRDFMISLTAEKNWLKKNSNFYTLKNLVLESPVFISKRLGCNNNNLYLDSLIESNKSIQKTQLKGFANYLSIKLDKNIKREFLNKTLKELSQENIDYLALTHDFLLDTKNRIDIYQDSVVLDMLLAIFSEDAPKRFITIMGAHMAKIFNEHLSAMGVVEHEQAFDGDEAVMGFLDI